MSTYDAETLAVIPGQSPKQKYENIVFLLGIAAQIAYPKRGTAEESKTLEDFADEISEKFPIEVLP